MDRLETPHPDFLKAKDRAEDYGGSLEYIKIDVRNNTEVNNTFAKIAAHEQRLDGLIAAAGINHLQSALEHSQQALDDVMSINYNGVFNSATAAARQMFNYQQKGSCYPARPLASYGVGSSRHPCEQSLPGAYHYSHGRGCFPAEPGGTGHLGSGEYAWSFGYA
jgi:NAD(P)-dependent dehydrogenase (short-subunit alcohol dehydrogenase family)